MKQQRTLITEQYIPTPENSKKKFQRTDAKASPLSKVNGIKKRARAYL